MKRPVIIILLVIIVLGSWFGYREWNRAHPNLANQKVQAIAAAQELIAAFQKDTASASRQYLDKIIAVTGVVKKIDAEDNPVVLFLGNAAEMSSVQCSMDSTDKAKYITMKIGATVTLKGVCNGYLYDELLGTDVLLNRCVVATNK